MAFLSVLFAPDKEAVAVFIFLGYYPILKPWFDRFRFGWLGKILLFNCAIGIMYLLLLKLFGMAELASDYAQLGIWGGAAMAVMGNITFILLDKLLAMLTGKK